MITSILSRWNESSRRRRIALGRRPERTLTTEVKETTSVEDEEKTSAIENDVSFTLDTRNVRCEDIPVKTNNESLTRYGCETNRARSFTDARNEVQPFDLATVTTPKMNMSGIERRCAEIGARRSVKKEWQAAWLLKGVTQIDLTTLSGDDTPGKVGRLCAKAKRPIREDI